MDKNRDSMSFIKQWQYWLANGLVILVVLIYFLFIYMPAQDDLPKGVIENDTISITTDKLREGFTLNNYRIKMKFGDNLQWTKPSYTDSSWQQAFPLLRLDTKNEANEINQGIVWLRQKFIFDESFQNTFINLSVRYWQGAAEIYWDGELVQAYGSVASRLDQEQIFQPQFIKFPVRVDKSGVHTLVVRFSYHHALSYARLGKYLDFIPIGKSYEKNPLEIQLWNNQNNTSTIQGVNEKIDSHRKQWLIAGICLALTLLHLCLYIFYQEYVSNLYYSFFLGSWGLYVLISSILYSIHQPDLLWECLFILNGINLTLLPWWYLMFITSVSRGSQPSFFAWYLILALVHLLLLITASYLEWGSDLVHFLSFTYLVIFFSRGIWMMLPLFGQESKGRNVLGLSALAFFLLICLNGFFEAKLNYGIWLLAQVSLPLGMSLYTGKKSGSIARELQIQLEKVRQLSKEKEVMLKNQNQVLEEEVNKKTAELEEAFQQLIQQEKMAALGIMTAGIMHEVKNPLNYLLLSSTNLRENITDILTVLKAFEDIKPDNIIEKMAQIDSLKEEYSFDLAIREVYHQLTAIEKGGRRADQIIQDLAIFSRRDESFKKTSRIEEVIEVALTLLGERFNKNQNISIIKDFGLLPPIEIYPGKLSQVFVNILANALDAIGSAGVITIKTRSLSDKEKYDYPNNRILVSIQDNGHGIPKNIQDKIFDPFFTTKEVGKGTGLGLSLSYGIVQEHQGKIELRSTESEGSEFRVYL